MKFGYFIFKPEFLAKHNLPDFRYPMPIDALDECLSANRNPGPEYLLVWLQMYSEEEKKEWPGLEEPMRALIRLLVSPERHTFADVSGDNWYFEAGRVDIGGEIVTIQRGHTVLAVMAPRKDGALCVEAYHPLDARSTNTIISLSQRPAPDGTVCMRPNNWEYARDNAALSVMQYHSFEAGSSYLSYWEKGLGVSNDGSLVLEFHAQRGATPMTPDETAVTVGCYFELHPEPGIG